MEKFKKDLVTHYLDDLITYTIIESNCYKVSSFNNTQICSKRTLTYFMDTTLDSIRYVKDENAV